jgi:hypothetical protein
MPIPGEKFEKQQGVRWLLDHIDQPAREVESTDYQVLLRALGSWLDGQAFSNYAVLETDDTFSVITRDDLGLGVLTVLGFAELLKPDPELRANGGPASARHQDFLRALGKELDMLLARNILLEELPEGLLLTYFIQPPENRLMWRKQHVMLDAVDRSKLLTKAVAHRSRIGHGRWGLKVQRKR